MDSWQENWPTTPAEAVEVQERLRPLVQTNHDDFPEHVTRVAGVDVGFPGGGDTARAVVVVLDFPSLAPVENAVAFQKVRFPYVPGFLSFRELPAVLDAFSRLRTRPDLVLCDGQGIAHPRRLGIATHLGLCIDLPTIGVGKSILCGTHGPVPDQKGEWTPLRHKGETIGAMLRTRVGVQPLIISPGHRISLVSAIAWVMRCTTRYRLPETTRHAHRLASHGETMAST